MSQGETKGEVRALGGIYHNSMSTPSMLPDELSYLITAFLPSNPSTTRTKAYLTLSAFCEGVRSSSVEKENPNSDTRVLVKVFEPLVVSRLAETDESALLAGVSFLTALFQVNWQSASLIFQQDGVLEAIMDSVDITPSAQLARSVAQLLSQVCGHKHCRTTLTSQSIQWLDFSSRSSDVNLRAVAAIALIKLFKGTSADHSEVTGDVNRTAHIHVENITRKDMDLAATMKEIVVSGNDSTSTTDAVEGLAYLSIDPTIKETLSLDAQFLQQLFTLIRRPKAVASDKFPEPASTLIFGVLVIIANLCAYRPRLSEEETQIQKLREMARVKSTPTTSTSAFDDDEHVRIRIRRLVDIGVLDVFAAAVRTDSPGIRIMSGKALLSIVEDKENRGKVLQSGGAKVLTLIIKHAISDPSPNRSSPAPDPAYLGSIQALAKLTITSSPVQVFGPNEGVMYDAIRPLSLMLQGPSSTLLQRFESIMALTNLSSQSAEMASRIAKSEGLLNRVELFLLEDHTLVRRAAMELICNLVAGSDEVFERYGGGDNLNSTKSKLQVLLALSDVDDLPTRLAASGAVATLTSAPSACQNLISIQYERHRVFPILAQLIDPSTAHTDGLSGEIHGDNEAHPGLIHRAVICTRNIFLSISDIVSRRKLSKEAEEAGLLQALLNLVRVEGKKAEGVVLHPAAETLKIMMGKT